VSMFDEIRFWMQVMTDAERTVVCSPELESRCKTWVDARGMGHLITVKVSQTCPDETIFLFDERGIDAEMRKAMLAPIRLGGGA